MGLSISMHRIILCTFSTVDLEFKQYCLVKSISLPNKLFSTKNGPHPNTFSSFLMLNKLELNSCSIFKSLRHSHVAKSSWIVLNKNCVHSKAGFLEIKLLVSMFKASMKPRCAPWTSARIGFNSCFEPKLTVALEFKFMNFIQRMRSRMLMVPAVRLFLEKNCCFESQRRKEHIVFLQISFIIGSSSLRSLSA